MPDGDLKALHQQSWDRLNELIEQRDSLFHRLDALVHMAMGMPLTTGVVVKFELAMAQKLLRSVEELAPLISAAVDEHNRYAAQLGKPQITWQEMDVRDL